MRVVALCNHGAGRAGAPGDELAEILAAAGHQPHVLALEDPAWPERLRSLLPADLLLVVGGDGTVAELVRRVDIGHTPFTLLPVGTANNLALHLGISGTPSDLVAAWRGWEERAFDFGKVSAPWGEYLFLESSGLGLLADAMPILSALKNGAHLPKREDELSHDRVALARLLQSYRARALTLTTDRGRIQGDYLVVAVLNNGRLGPRLSLAPHASTGDGQLDLVVCTDADRERLAQLLADGEHTEPLLPVVPVRWMEFEWSGAPFHVDDRVFAGPSSSLEKFEPVPVPEGTDPTVRIEVVPGAARVLAPPTPEGKVESESGKKSC